ncbi:hypothetical protein Thimo_3467 [Thioflavicoccus mobilis 8321]|uniref:Uncharacterized protein n=1 Tax=Thioflavicoccus mobilis 8321 TaxID=765912 RepID=L0H391_9GAMM|nr:hypothetical protein Thimo_3467 [Thioflavicoccus mobilis 8321]
MDIGPINAAPSQAAHESTVASGGTSPQERLNNDCDERTDDEKLRNTRNSRKYREHSCVYPTLSRLSRVS